ncbi:MAG: hypothetical protein U5N85_15110 [Arcicella sp.]|nr:hypothetical protein [Arcicella sp.]
MKKSKTAIEEFKSVKEYTQKIFLEDKEEKNQVSLKIQEEEIKKIEAGLRFEQFYFVVDVVNFKIIKAKGLETLGYHTETFDLLQYAQTIASKGVLDLMGVFWKNIFDFNQKGISHLQFLKPKFIAQIPMKHKNGDIYLIKRSITPFQYTNTGKLTQYLSEFTIVKKFNNEAPEPRFMDMPETFVEKFNLFVSSSFIWEESPFSSKEMDILRKYVSTDRNQTAKQLSLELSMTTETLKFYNKEILRKAKDYFGEIYSFDTAMDVAFFLKNCGVMG